MVNISVKFQYDLIKDEQAATILKQAPFILFLLSFQQASSL